MPLDDIAYQQAQTVEANGLSLCYDSFGNPEDPPVILIMGLATQMIYWDPSFCRQLASHGFWVVRFDNRDIGLSSKIKSAPLPSMMSILANHWFSRGLDAPYMLDDMARDTLGLMDALQLSSAHLSGVSMGGMIAQCTALMAPERVRSLTSIMSTTGNRSLPGPSTKVSMQMIKPVPKDMEEFVQHGLSMWKMLNGKVFPFEAERVETLIRAARERSFYPKGILRQLCAIMASRDRTAELSKLDLPTLVMHGDADPLVPVACGIATAECIPDAQLHIFKGMGHTLPQSLWPALTDKIAALAKAAE